MEGPAEGAAGETSMDRDVRTTRQGGWAARVIAAVAIGAFTFSMACLGMLTAPSSRAGELAAASGAAGLPAATPSTEPAGGASSARPEAETRTLTASRPGPSSPEDRPIGRPFLQNDNSTVKLVLALLVVVLVLWGLRRLLRGRAGMGGSAGAAGPLEVVASLRLSPTHQVRLVRLGRRLIAVGLTGQSIATLAEVSDPREIADLLEQAGVKRPAGSAGLGPGIDYVHDTTTREKLPPPRKGDSA